MSSIQPCRSSGSSRHQTIATVDRTCGSRLPCGRKPTDRWSPSSDEVIARHACGGIVGGVRDATRIRTASRALRRRDGREPMRSGPLDIDPAIGCCAEDGSVDAEGFVRSTAHHVRQGVGSAVLGPSVRRSRVVPCPRNRFSASVPTFDPDSPSATGCEARRARLLTGPRRQVTGPRRQVVHPADRLPTFRSLRIGRRVRPAVRFAVRHPILSRCRSALAGRTATCQGCAAGPDVADCGASDPLGSRQPSATEHPDDPDHPGRIWWETLWVSGFEGASAYCPVFG